MQQFSNLVGDFRLKKAIMMRNQRYLLTFIGLLALSLPVQANNAVYLSQSSNPATTFDSYRQECLQRARAEGLAADVAKDLCDCTIKKFQARYNLQQFRTLVQKSKTDKAAARTLASVGEACFDEILYE
jgi:translation elongation factor EF-Ts